MHMLTSYLTLVAVPATLVKSPAQAGDNLSLIHASKSIL